MTVENHRPAEGVQRYADLATGMTRTTLDITERALAHFVRQGEVAAEHAERLIDDVIARSIESSGVLASVVRREVERAAERAGFVSTAELAALRHEVQVLREQLAGQAGDAESTDGETAP